MKNLLSRTEKQNMQSYCDIIITSQPQSIINITTHILLINLKSLHYNIYFFLIKLTKIFLNILSSLIKRSDRIEFHSIRSNLLNLRIKDRMIQSYIDWDRTGSNHYAVYLIERISKNGFLIFLLLRLHPNFDQVIILQ